MSRPVRGPVLGIETSCDETSAAVVLERRILGQVIASQDAHAAFGGVVPEIAARAHLRKLDRVVQATLEEADLPAEKLAGVGVTAGPGLVGSLLVGVNWAKAFAFARGLPLLGVHHMEAHLFAGVLEAPEARPPFVALLVSGGHTLLLFASEWGRYVLLGRTRDDAAGEAFDKVARRLGLGYPGGPEIQRVAEAGRPGRFSLPRPMLRPADTPEDDAYFDFSFSGLKTAVALLAEELEAGGPDSLEAGGPDSLEPVRADSLEPVRADSLEAGGPGPLEAARADIAAEFQTAVVEVLTAKTLRAVEFTGCRRVVLGGGVACNAALRARLASELEPEGALFAASPRLSTDNGAMVACLAAHRLGRGERSGWELNADPNLPFPGLTAWRGEPINARATADEEMPCIPS